MKPGDVVLIRFPQTDLLIGKLRPALVVAIAPGRHADLLLALNIAPGLVQHGLCGGFAPHESLYVGRLSTEGDRQPGIITWRELLCNVLSAPPLST